MHDNGEEGGQLWVEEEDWGVVLQLLRWAVQGEDDLL